MDEPTAWDELEAAISGALWRYAQAVSGIRHRGPGEYLEGSTFEIQRMYLAGLAGDVLLLLAVTHWGTGGPLAALFPGLLLLGAGQGLCITPLTTTVLSHADATRAGSVSGALSTAQQVGNAIGVAVTGVVFYGLLSRGYAIAYQWSVAEMALLLLGVAALAFTIPRKEG